MIPRAWLCTSHVKRHVSLHLDIERATQTACEMHGTVEPLLAESDVRSFVAELLLVIESHGWAPPPSQSRG